MAPFARAELEQIGRKMACNEYFGASLVDGTLISDSKNSSRYRFIGIMGLD